MYYGVNFRLLRLIKKKITILNKDEYLKQLYIFQLFFSKKFVHICPSNFYHMINLYVLLLLYDNLTYTTRKNTFCFDVFAMALNAVTNNEVFALAASTIARIGFYDEFLQRCITALAESPLFCLFYQREKACES